MPRDLFVDVYRKDNGRKQRVPAAWMDDSRLSRPFRKTPSSKGGSQQAPSNTATVESQTDDPTPSTTETPATGE